MKSFFMFLIYIGLIFPLSAQENSDNTMAMSFVKSSELRYSMLFKKSQTDTTEPVKWGMKEPLKLKKPSVGVLLSAAVPGAGEIYAGSWKKGLIFLGVEAAMWIGYFTY